MNSSVTVVDKLVTEKFVIDCDTGLHHPTWNFPGYDSRTAEVTRTPVGELRSTSATNAVCLQCLSITKPSLATVEAGSLRPKKSLHWQKNTLCTFTTMYVFIGSASLDT
jgi:hypothetical protein